MLFVSSGKEKKNKSFKFYTNTIVLFFKILTDFAGQNYILTAHNWQKWKIRFLQVSATKCMG